MSEKFRDIVNAPHRAFGHARRRIAANHPSRPAARVARGAGLTVTGLFQFLCWVTKYVALDNAVLRGMEKSLAAGGKKSGRHTNKLSTLIKNNPNLSAHLIYYTMLGAIAGGADFAVNTAPDMVQNYKEWRAARDASAAVAGTYAAYLNKMRPLTPFLIADLIQKEGVHLDSKTGLHTPYRDGNGVPTIGFGSTVLKDGRRVTMRTPPITNDEAYELARHHIEDGETYFVMYCYDVANSNMNIRTPVQALGIASIIYNAHGKLIEQAGDKNFENRFEVLRKLYDEYGYAVRDADVIDAFNKYPIENPTSLGNLLLSGACMSDVADKLGEFLKEGGGIQWRRWIEAGLLTNKISPQMMLRCPVRGMYEFYCRMGQCREAFFVGDVGARRVNDETFDKFYKWLDNPVDKSGHLISGNGWSMVTDYLPADIVAQCMSDDLGNKNKRFRKPKSAAVDIERNAYVLGYDELYNAALDDFNAGKYDAAATRFADMIKQYPDNALLYNDLAATYNKMGRYDDAIRCAREIVRRIGDKSQYAAAQYNAGYAYEQKGNLARALENYKLARANGNYRVQSDISRVTNKMRDANNKIAAFSDGASRLDDDNHDMNAYVWNIDVTNQNS